MTRTSARLALALALACVLGGLACAPEPPTSYDASFNEPFDGGSAECFLGVHGGDPATQCSATWQCVTAGTLRLVCGEGLDPGGPVCLCLSEQAQTTVGLPTSCTDEAVITAFARTECGWSSL